jgi:hypothetical protein
LPGVKVLPPDGIVLALGFAVAMTVLPVLRRP